MLNANWYAILILILLQKVLILIFDFDLIIQANHTSMLNIKNYAKDCVYVYHNGITFKLHHPRIELFKYSTQINEQILCLRQEVMFLSFSGPCSFAMPQKSPWPHHPHHSFKSFLIIILELCTHYYKWMSVDDDLNQLGNLCVMYLSKG